VASTTILGAICANIVDCEHKTAPEAAPGTEYAYSIGTPHIRNGRILFDAAKRVDQQTYESWTVREVPREDDLILAREAPVGQVGRISEGDRVCLGQRTVLLRPDAARVNPRYLHYLLLSPLVQETMASKATGSTVSHLNVKDIRDLPLPPLPTLPYQTAVAELLSALDDKLALNEHILAKALKLADCHFSKVARATTSATTLELLARSGDISFGDGYRTSRAELGHPGIPILRVAEVHEDSIRPTLEDHVRTSFRSSMGQKRSLPGDVILTTKGTVGRVAIIPDDAPEFVYSPQICYFRVPDGSSLSSAYIFHWFRGREFWSQASFLKGNTDMADYLSLRDIRSLRISVAGSQEMAGFEEKVGPLRQMTDSRQGENRVLSTLRDTLLRQLMSGRLRVKEAEKLVEDAT
jgi:type I restriction enzyme, S subunit